MPTLLAVLLVAVAALALTLHRDAHAPGAAQAPQGLRSVAAPVANSAHYERVVDGAGILAPFAPRLARMADAFYDDLGIDLHIVTTTSPSELIAAQADATFHERRIGADA